ncbi:Amino acid transporter, transmembrane [Artemisia annua]|uniref:Amino acid transporter, transmembrane n=1 Tax=Artemisia annua TaxID=35608 RepID=A0A2U1KNS5_ARTAN|nr:Amino acid transporter, transmembrane [Artemisia annua]
MKLGIEKVDIHIILRFSKGAKVGSYGALVGDAFGQGGKMVLQLGIVVNNVGLLVVYMIIIGDVLSGTWSEGEHHLGVMQEWFGHHWWTGRSVLLLLTTLLVLAPLISFKRVGDPISYIVFDSGKRSTISAETGCDNVCNCLTNNTKSSIMFIAYSKILVVSASKRVAIH